MGDPLPPDPYLALGVAKDATGAAIKAQYRKLVLKCHPDKIQDETEKQHASDKFHKIQTAYEIVGDEARRARYDAQCKLAELRKDVFGGGAGAGKGSSEVRTASYKMPTDSARGGDFYTRGPDRYGARVSPLYEERRPSYAGDGDYFSEAPTSRPTSRKYDDYERSKRTSPREEREKPKTSAKEAKDSERSSRKDKSRRTDKDVRKERERKFAYVDSESESDQYERARRRAQQEEDGLRRAQEQYYATENRQREEAENGYYADERTRKMFTQGSDAKDYIERSRTAPQPRQESESRQQRRPSPVRKSSSREKVEYIDRKEKPAIMIRRGSGKPQTVRRDSGKPPKSEKTRRGSFESADEAPRRPPTLNQTKSSPADIRPPFARQRSSTTQEDQHKDEPPMPQFRRSETMPLSASSAMPQRESRRKEGSKLRHEEAYITPDPTPEPEPRKYNYGHQYADDAEYPTPDGYRTEYREPVQQQQSRQRLTRSPSPIRERERQRSTSKQTGSAPQPPPMSRTTSTQYSYADRDPVRPAPTRADSSRGNLFGEIGNQGSPRPQGYAYSPPPESVQTSKKFREEDVKFQTGYSSRRPKMSERPSYSRSGSSRHPVYVK